MNFRHDINGLRAIAVIAVVLFHFNPSWLPGGFAGVDVFFVISGFLMTGIIFKGIEQENFSIFRFYVARANRIIPSLAVLCIVLLVFGWCFLTPTDYKALAKHTVSSISFLSNIIYWKESGYFDAASHEKWLLHTWSLSVEWQFYIIYPLMLTAMRKFMSLKVMKAMILLGTAIGFIFCVIATYKWPSESFYLLPTRAWEMMLGGVAYLYPLALKEQWKRHVEKLGLVLIAGSYLFISKENHWPGYLAILPVSGTFLIIQAQRSRSFITTNLLFQKIGAWSYSIYLWHWPLVVFIYYFSLNESYIFMGILLSVLLGYINNKYVEKIKFRNDFDNLFSYLKCKPLYMIFVVGLVGFGCYFYYFDFNGSKSTILGHNYLNTKGDMEFNSAGTVRVLNGLDSLDDIDLLMVGDSNSAHYSYGITASNNFNVAHKWVGSCLPFINMNTKPHAGWMDAQWEINCHSLYQFVNVNKSVPVVIASQWGDREIECIEDCMPRNVNADYFLSVRSELRKIIEYIGDRPIFLIGQVPAPLNSMVSCMRGFNSNLCERVSTEFLGDRVKTNKLLAEVSDGYKNVFFINPFNSICDEMGVCNTIINNKNIFYDAGHLSAFGSENVWAYIEDEIVKYLN